MPVSPNEITQCLQNVSLMIWALRERCCMHFNQIQELVCKEGSYLEKLFVCLEL
jgi:hypothetical protein